VVAQVLDDPGDRAADVGAGGLPACLGKQFAAAVKLDFDAAKLFESAAAEPGSGLLNAFLGFDSGGGGARQAGIQHGALTPQAPDLALGIDMGKLGRQPLLHQVPRHDKFALRQGEFTHHRLAPGTQLGFRLPALLDLGAEHGDAAGQFATPGAQRALFGVGDIGLARCKVVGKARLAVRRFGAQSGTAQPQTAEPGFQFLASQPVRTEHQPQQRCAGLDAIALAYVNSLDHAAFKMLDHLDVSERHHLAGRDRNLVQPGDRRPAQSAG